MPSEFYKENWKRTNEWLTANAPDYVLKCIWELSLLAKELGDEMVAIDKVLPLLEEELERGREADLKRLERMHKNRFWPF